MSVWVGEPAIAPILARTRGAARAAGSSDYFRRMSFLVPHRFCGPPASGNGGWVGGHLSRLVGITPDHPAVTVRLRTPPPLDRDLEVRRDGETVLVVDGDAVVAQASPAVRLPDVPLRPVGLTEAEEAQSRYEGLVDHPFPTCFSCGIAGEPDDGLRLQPGPLAEHSAYACVWTPADDADVETVWAALDCPGGWASGIAGRPMVLGTMTTQLRSAPEAGRPHVVMAWQRGAEGRKHLSGTAVFAPDGRLVAQAEATWIAVDPSTIRPAGGSA